jgi:methylmalonyl-CoA mutase
MSRLIDQWPSVVAKNTRQIFLNTKVRDKIIKQPITVKSLSGSRIPKVVLPKYKDWGDILRWQLAGKSSRRCFPILPACLN